LIWGFFLGPIGAGRKLHKGKERDGESEKKVRERERSSQFIASKISLYPY
jgi:hypothetical protein